MDNGTPRMSSTVSVRISINPVNEFDPVFMPASYGPVAVLENVAIGTFVVRVTATDEDKGKNQGTVRYQIVNGDPQQQFTIDETSGNINVSRALDREAVDAYTLTVRAADSTPGSADVRTADTTVRITITDVNDVTPVFNPTVYTVDVLESAAAGPNVVLKQLTVQDDDFGINSQTFIRIISGNSELKFSIDGTRLILTNKLDYETTSSYNLVLEVVDGGSPRLSSTGTVIVRVLPENDNAPIMISASVTETIPEDTPVGRLVYDANATDADGEVDGQITYSIESGVNNNEFIIDPMTGKLFVGSILDFDTLPTSYSIIIRATDSGGQTSPSSTVSLSIILSDVNDNAPQFDLTTYTFNVNENVAVGTTVGKLTVTDKDSSINGQITLAIKGGSGQNMFSLDSGTMEIRTSAGIDYESNQVLFLSVTASDAGNPVRKSETIVRININNMNDNMPVLSPNDIAVTVPENAAVGTTVQTYSASDEDTSIAAFRLGNTDDHFAINAMNGAVTVKALLDRETMASHILTVLVLDRSTTVDTTVHTATATLTIIIEDVNDNSPVIRGFYEATLTESTPLNTLVFQINASDADSGVNAQLAYAITSGNTNNAFSIDTVGNVRVVKALDYDVANRYTLTITVKDSGSPSRSATVSAEVRVVNVNDPPMFTSAAYTFRVDENSPVGTTVGTVAATDDDAGNNGQVTYTFGAFSEGSSSHFLLNSQTGVITVAVASLDYESVPVYRGMVVAMDGGIPLRQSATVELTIIINNIDDNPFMFSPTTYSGTVAENSATSTSIVQLMTFDLDNVGTTSMTYRIDTSSSDGKSADNMLQVDSDGTIRPKINLDYESNGPKRLEFLVIGTKGGETATATVTISITDVNDNNPVFPSDFINTEVAYTGECEETIVTLLASDADSGPNGEISYELITTEYSNLFSVNSVTGRLTMDTQVVKNTEYDLVVRASDHGNPQRSATTTVRIDSYPPTAYVVRIKLGISRTSFLSRQAQFLNSLQKIFRKNYPAAIARLWCITEYDGQAQSPDISSVVKRQADRPVIVSIYGLRDDTTESKSNVGVEKSFLSQQEILQMLTADDRGTPSNDLKGSEFEYFRINNVDNFSEADNDSESWWDTVYGPLITALLIALALILLAVLIYCCCRHCGTDKRSSDRKSFSSQEEDSQPHRNDWRSHAALRDAEYGIPYAHAYPAGVMWESTEDIYAPKHNRYM